MDSLKKINIILSFGTEGIDQESSGSFQIEGALPGPPELGGSADGQSESGSSSLLPPPPGYSSEEKSFSGSDDKNSGGGPPPPPGSGIKPGTGTQDMGPPESGENIGNTYASPSPPALERDPYPSGKKGNAKG